MGKVIWILCSKLLSRVVAAVLCVVGVIVQGWILNRFFVQYYDSSWFAWTVADIAVAIVFSFAFFKSLRHFRMHYEECVIDNVNGEKQEQVIPGALPFGYLVWLLYGIVLSIKIVILFLRIAQTLDNHGFFNSNTLKTTIACSAIIFMVLVSMHHKTDDNSYQYTVIKELSTSGTFNILDTVQLLQVLFVKESRILLTFRMHYTILAITVVNVLLPTLPLVILGRLNFNSTENRKVIPRVLHLLHRMCSLFLVNVGMFIVRLLLWHLYTHDISIFIIKNVLGIGVGLKGLLKECVTTYEYKKEHEAMPLQMDPLTPSRQSALIPSDCENLEHLSDVEHITKQEIVLV